MALTSSASDKNLVALAQGSLPYSRPPTPPSSHLRLGWLGLGAMGYHMAKNLATHQQHPAGSPPILLYNRTKSRSEALLAEVGAKVRIADTPGQLAIECDVIFTSLGSDEAVGEVYRSFYSAIEDTNHSSPVPKIFVETSTIFPALASELDALMSQLPHVHFISGPVFGPPSAASQRQLLQILSGDYRSKKVVAYLLVPAVARKVIDLGGNIEKAPTFKLLGNSMVLGSIELMGEALTLAEKSGCGADKLMDFIKGIIDPYIIAPYADSRIEFFPAGPFINYGSKMLNDEFDGSKGFAIDGGIKDATHIRRLTSLHNSPMPTIDIAHGNLLTARAIHQKQLAEGSAKHPILDWSALVAGPRMAAGLPGLDSTEMHSKLIRDE